MRAQLLLWMVIGVTLGWAAAEPDADASPDAAPDAAADAQTISFGGTSGPLTNGYYGSGIPLYPPPQPPNTCPMADNCCNVPDEGCCLGGQQCYTIYKRECKYQNKPACRTMNKKHCEKIAVRSCRVKREFKYYDVPTLQCTPKFDTQCFNYTERVCNKVPDKGFVEIQWVDQQLSVDGSEYEKCHPIKRCRIVNATRVQTTQVPETKCNPVKIPKRVCRTETVMPPAKTMYRTVVDIIYKDQCYNVPRTQCTTVGCSTGGCQEDWNVCSSTATRTENVCNECGEIGQCQPNKCQQVEVPSCSYGNTNCLPGPQQCCKTVYESVCQKVPIKITRSVPETYQPPPIYKPVCETDYIEKEDCRTVMVSKQIEIPYQKCERYDDTYCQKIPKNEYSVNDVPKGTTESYPKEKCEYNTVMRKRCVKVQKDVDCQERQGARKRVDITKNVCDVLKYRPFCYDIVQEYCENNQGQVCNMVPKQVCQDTCQQTDRCNQCSSFVGGGGYSGCGQPTCSNFIPREAGSQFITS